MLKVNILTTNIHKIGLYQNIYNIYYYLVGIFLIKQRKIN